MADATTPLMRQYHSLKEQVPRALLMFRLGDFYELFFDDAITAARELEITLTARNKEKGQPIPMCGVPYHAAESYIAKLVQKGYRVALCDQMEAAGPGKKLVRRDLTRIVTPGTVTSSNLLRTGENSYLAALNVEGQRAGVAFADVSTGEFRATEMAAHEARPFLEGLKAREILEPSPESMDSWTFGTDYAGRALLDHFRLHSLDGCGLGGKHLATGAAGAILHYLKETQRAAFDHLDRPTWFERGDAMVLDAVTIRNLELVDPLFSDDSSREATVLATIDRTLTGMGARLLRARLLRPSLDRAEIAARLDAVEELAAAIIPRTEARKVLGRILDLERLLARIAVGTGNPRDLLALGKSLEQIPALNASLQAMSRQGMLPEDLANLREAILSAIAEEPPINLTDGGTIRAGKSPQLDELRDIQANSRQYIAAIETRERQSTGIASLKVRFNNVFGYYIEISKANLHLAPTTYERKQTLVNAERFTTPELKELEAKVLEAEEKILTLEREIFEALRARIATEAFSIRAVAAAIARIDVQAALSELAVERRYARPQFSSDEESILRVEAGRHPVIEALTERDAQRFVPNDLYLDPSRFLAIITGPNMGGKSTYLRQAAMIVILAQMGSFVPASAAMLPIVDRVFTRVGASDNLSRGRSTFMVEMTETASILNSATDRSLIVLDEIGRGTATYDGLAIAWAVAEYIQSRVRAKTLFATHYHELTDLADRLDGVVNLRVTVKEADDRILFLRKVEPGAADKSYGIEVARLAALPDAVIERAREVLALHERSEHSVTDELAPDTSLPQQIRLFEPVNGQIADRVRALKLDELRPIEALQILAELQKDLQ